MATIAQSLAVFHELKAVSDSARLDCEVLLCHVLDKQRVYLYTWPEKALTQEQESQFSDYIERRKKGEPVAYILGQKEFWSLPFLVNSSTLIPRPDTELLVELVLELLADDGQAVRHVADFGTGTGAIALAIASERPDWSVCGYEKYDDALALAQQNQQRLGFDNAQMRQSDWFSNVGDQIFDLIVANPPYIEPDDVHLSQGDVRFEPKTALVSEADGLEDLQHIIQFAPSYLSSGGFLLLEHGFQQSDAVQGIFREQGFVDVSTHHDLSGNPRVTRGRKV